MEVNNTIMKKLNILITFSVFVIIGCGNPKRKTELVTNLNQTVSDTVFVKTLDKYIKLIEGLRKSKFIQVFVNYEQNISRYIFITTKSLYDLKTEIPFDFFYYKDYVVLLYSGYDYIFKTKKNFPNNFDDFIKEEELFKDIDNSGNFTSNFTSENILLGSNCWELRIYHSFNDSIVLNTNYEGRFIWDGSRVKFDTTAKFVPPVIYEDKVDYK